MRTVVWKGSGTRKMNELRPFERRVTEKEITKYTPIKQVPPFPKETTRFPILVRVFDACRKQTTPVKIRISQATQKFADV